MRLRYKSFYLFQRPVNLTVSGFADKYRVLSPEASAEPGRWRTSRAEYQRGVMDAFNDPAIDTVVFMKSAQVGASELLNNVLAYYMAYAPCPLLLVQPTADMAKTYSKDRIAPMIRDTPKLKAVVSEAKGRDANNTLSQKHFIGGHVTMIGSNAPSQLASRPIKVVLFDEVDRFNVNIEGDVIALASKRQTTFWDRKRMITSTPTIKGASRIELAFEGSDQRRYFVPCPDCGEFILLEWKNLKWEGEDVWYECENCGVCIEEKYKLKMVAKGVWRPTAEASAKKTAGFHINELYSPWVTWAQMRDNFLEAKKFPETLKTWVNTSLGETWEEQGEGIDDQELRTRVEPYERETILPKVVLVTCGVDIQDDRAELEVVGWCPYEESYSLDYIILHGDPERQDLWNRLDDILQTEFNGLKIRMMFIDSGAHTQAVYRYCKRRAKRGVYAVKGQSHQGKPTSSRPARRKKGEDVKPVPIGTDTAKDVIYGRLKIETVGPGYCHFPERYDDEYFAMLTAEEVIIKHVQGVPKRVYRKKRPRNEALDCRVYAYAAMHYLNPELVVMAKKKQDIEDKKDKVVEVVNKPVGRKPMRPKRSGFVGGWR